VLSWNVQSLKNVTITLDEKIAAQVRVKAATRGKSVSKFISELLEREIGRDEKKSGLQAIEEYLDGPLWPISDENGRLPTREEIYGERADELLRQRVAKPG
jgi:plasmid stability protein